MNAAEHALRIRIPAYTEFCSLGIETYSELVLQKKTGIKVDLKLSGILV